MFDYDWLIVGSGFGGSVSALRLSEKGYRVAVLEKGGRLGPEQFPKTNWNLKRWLWMPALGFRGLFKMTFYPHVTVLSGVGVGGGSLVYANTLPIPKAGFFQAKSWSHLADWQAELAPHYQTARRMLGATPNPYTSVPDQILRELATEDGRPEAFSPTTLAVYYGEPGKTVADPYFGGKGPERTGCIQCGGCMIGCRYGAKNTLDKNYLYLAEQLGAQVHPDTEVTHVRPLPGGGYEVEALHGDSAFRFRRAKRRYTAQRVIFAGGVTGTIDLLLQLKRRPDGLPRLSDNLGHYVRTNSEALLAITSTAERMKELGTDDLSRGLAIGSIYHTDEHSHLEPVRYSKGSGFFKILGAPHGPGDTLGQRLKASVKQVAAHPRKLARSYFGPDWARHTMILLYMRSLEGHIRLKRGRSWLGLFRKSTISQLSQGPAPTASIPEATALAYRVADKLDATPTSMTTETLLGIPTTAHILGGACMGADAAEGVIDSQHRVFGYEGLYVIDGSAVSANPGVNPSLTITALAERAMTFIAAKETT